MVANDVVPTVIPTEDTDKKEEIEEDDDIDFDDDVKLSQLDQEFIEKLTSGRKEKFYLAKDKEIERELMSIEDYQTDIFDDDTKMIMRELNFCFAMIDLFTLEANNDMPDPKYNIPLCLENFVTRSGTLILFIYYLFKSDIDELVDDEKKNAYEIIIKEVEQLFNNHNIFNINDIQDRKKFIYDFKIKNPIIFESCSKKLDLDNDNYMRTLFDDMAHIMSNRLFVERYFIYYNTCSQEDDNKEDISDILIKVDDNINLDEEEDESKLTSEQKAEKAENERKIGDSEILDLQLLFGFMALKYFDSVDSANSGEKMEDLLINTSDQYKHNKVILDVYCAFQSQMFNCFHSDNIEKIFNTPNITDADIKNIQSMPGFEWLKDPDDITEEDIKNMSNLNINDTNTESCSSYSGNDSMDTS